MAEALPKMRVKGSESVRMAILCAIGVAFANGVFFILSYAYYKAHATNLGEGTGLTYYQIDKDALWSTRETFLVLSLITGGVAFVATRIPREVGHGLATLLGLTCLAASYGAFDRSLPTVMGVTLFVAGLLMPTLAYFSWNKSRAAWAFLIALVAVFGGVDLFGAPKVRALARIDLWTAMIFPALQIVTVCALAAKRRDYAR